MGRERASCQRPRRPRCQHKRQGPAPGPSALLGEGEMVSLRPCGRLSQESTLMHLTPREQEKLLIHVAADLARKRRARGLKLNYPEAMAILAAEILEAARDGKSVSEIMTLGGNVL